MKATISKEDHLPANHDVAQIDSKAPSLANDGAKLKLPSDTELESRTAARTYVLDFFHVASNVKHRETADLNGQMSLTFSMIQIVCLILVASAVVSEAQFRKC